MDRLKIGPAQPVGEPPRPRPKRHGNETPMPGYASRGEQRQSPEPKVRRYQQQVASFVARNMR